MRSSFPCRATIGKMSHVGSTGNFNRAEESKRQGDDSERENEVARGLRRSGDGKGKGEDRARMRDLTDKNKMRYFCKAFDVHRNPRNVSKISADISDNALSLLK